MIHPTAIIDPGARLDPTVEVGPYAIIDAHVVLGPGCRVGPHAHITGHTTIGAGNVFHTGCVIGDAPQDLKYDGGPTRLQVGDNNVFREHVSVHRSNKLSDDTRIGSGNFIMANAHVGHNAIVGNNTIIANGALLAGHATVADRAFLSGNSLVHQFARVGMLALMQGGAAISKDLPPFTVARGRNGMCGLNIIGLRRAGYSSEQRLELKRLYHDLFRRGWKLREALAAASREYHGEPARQMIAFVEATRRGICTDTGFSAAGSAEEEEE
ncbi:MAG TPA: acyl-[acyl-carrier-protein]--UDP-N-acetylglucosamine O-acyltransferase [Verrucomicrobiales bacterium]|nr:acyl-[acyl-carrier-protein]--UDP-N-acetylglucosamine O-acyltransferase [Verrucomicrobiales bacterium]